MSSCVQCSRGLANEFRYCPYCGAVQRSKIVEYFRGHPEIDDGDLRVSAYLTSPRHVRFSIWRSQQAEAVISLDPDQAHRLGRFLLGGRPETRPIPSLRVASPQRAGAPQGCLRPALTCLSSPSRYPTAQERPMPKRTV